MTFLIPDVRLQFVRLFRPLPPHALNHKDNHVRYGCQIEITEERADAIIAVEPRLTNKFHASNLNPEMLGLGMSSNRMPLVDFAHTNSAKRLWEYRNYHNGDADLLLNGCVADVVLDIYKIETPHHRGYAVAPVAVYVKTMIETRDFNDYSAVAKLLNGKEKMQ